MKEIQRGFSLSQLVFTIMMVGILTSIAYPFYQKYVENTKLQEVRAAMLENAQFLERFYQKNGSFKQSSTQWPDLPIKEIGDFCIKVQGDAKGTPDGRFTLKAVARSDKNPKVLKINESFVTVSCETTESTCEDKAQHFANTDKSCKIFDS
ncbi:pilin [Neisseria sp. HMSC077D05]|uniref:type IV pilin protein n=1 Tax=Neisseria sp. HMSC077D05 TaxID=1715079 RepID=UPI0008A3A4EF|nr:type IV pilin protein [Neisseria sp. HMSC077D05]OFN31819.1 pilin [Neisseria sp. HMSC077D05]